MLMLCRDVMMPGETQKEKGKEKETGGINQTNHQTQTAKTKTIAVKFIKWWEQRNHHRFKNPFIHCTSNHPTLS